MTWAFAIVVAAVSGALVYLVFRVWGTGAAVVLGAVLGLVFKLVAPSPPAIILGPT
jgi:hypothetical protein